jgi:hypothetical protein
MSSVRRFVSDGMVNEFNDGFKFDEDMTKRDKCGRAMAMSIEGSTSTTSSTTHQRSTWLMFVMAQDHDQRLTA